MVDRRWIAAQVVSNERCEPVRRLVYFHQRAHRGEPDGSQRLVAVLPAKIGEGVAVETPTRLANVMDAGL